MKLAISLLFCGIAAAAEVTEPAVRLPTSRADLLRGEKLFQVHCALCHGQKGEGSRGPLLARAKLTRAPDDAALVRIIDNGIRGTEMPGAKAMSPNEIRQTAAYVRSLGKIAQQAVPGEPARGAEVFAGNGKCSSCHAIHGEGGVAGPDLSTIGASRSPAYIRESILNPAAALPDGYLLVTVIPNSGPRVTGIRVNEDSFSIQVRDSAGRSYSFWKKDLTKVEPQRGVSPMPSYQGKLSDTELTNLVAYLSSLKEDK